MVFAKAARVFFLGTRELYYSGKRFIHSFEITADTQAGLDPLSDPLEPRLPK
jgi:hypothetical protein